MPTGYLDPPVFIIEKHETAINISQTPFFYNDNGHPTYVKELPSSVTLLVPAPTDPRVAIGSEYVVSEVIGVKQNAPYGVETQLGFVADKVVFDPMWATRDVAAAFGITLVEQGQAVTPELPRQGAVTD